MAYNFVCVCCSYRAEGILNRGNIDALALQESQNLSIFFATNNSITTDLKKHLEEVRLNEAGGRKRGGRVVCVGKCGWLVWVEYLIVSGCISETCDMVSFSAVSSCCLNKAIKCWKD